MTRLKVLDPARIPRTIRLRVELVQVPSGWAFAKWGAPHHRERMSEFWAFELANGAVAVLEQVEGMASLVISSDSEDTEMLRTELDVRSLASADFVHALSADEVRAMAADCRKSGRTLADAFVAFEGRGPDLARLFEALAATYDSSVEEVRDVWMRQYPSSSPFALSVPPVRPGTGT